MMPSGISNPSGPPSTVLSEILSDGRYGILQTMRSNFAPSASAPLQQTRFWNFVWDFNEVKSMSVATTKENFVDKTLALYSNNKILIDKIAYYLQDYVSVLKNADFLIAIIDLETEHNIDGGEVNIISHSFKDGKVDYDHNSKLSYIYSNERFMIVGPAAQNIHRINEFIYTVAEESGCSI